MTLGDDLEAASAKRASKKVVQAVADLFERSGIDVEDVGRVQRVNLWQGFYKDEDSQAQTVDMAGVSFIPRWADGPEWPVVQPGPPVKVPTTKARSGLRRGWKTAVVLPDMQIGYYRDADGELVPTHDESAINIALRIVVEAAPDLVVCVGDNLDLPEFGRYRLTPAYAQTTQPAIDRATLLCGELRRAAPDARIVWLAGNHEERMPLYLLDNAKAAFGLRVGDAPPESWPVMSVPNLCRMDDHGIEYMPGYPASHVWITPRLKVVHGDRVVSTGSTAHRYLQNEKTSVIAGHIHRREYGARTRGDFGGPVEVMAASPGCLCRVDGAVPSTKQGTDLDGRPLIRHEDWQQGFAVVPYDTESGRFAYEQVAIEEGFAFWRGNPYEAV